MQLDLNDSTLVPMVETVATLLGFVILFMRVKWQGEQNAAEIRALGVRVAQDHKALGVAQHDMAKYLGGRVDILFSKNGQLETKQAVTEAKVVSLIPQVQRNQDHIDQMGVQAGIGRPIAG